MSEARRGRDGRFVRREATGSAPGAANEAEARNMGAQASVGEPPAEREPAPREAAREEPREELREQPRAEPREQVREQPRDDSREESREAASAGLAEPPARARPARSRDEGASGGAGSSRSAGSATSSTTTVSPTCATRPKRPRTRPLTVA